MSTCSSTTNVSHISYLLFHVRVVGYETSIYTELLYINLIS